MNPTRLLEKLKVGLVINSPIYVMHFVLFSSFSPLFSSPLPVPLPVPPPLFSFPLLLSPVLFLLLSNMSM